MDANAIDHVNLRVPENGLDRAIDFYHDRLGFEIEGLERYENDEKPFFDVRLAEHAVIHLWPTEEFEAPSGDGFNHLAVLVETDIEALKGDLEDAGLEIESELDSPLGAVGTAPAVYIRDPFGYRVELKTSEV